MGQNCKFFQQKSPQALNWPIWSNFLTIPQWFSKKFSIIFSSLSISYQVPLLAMPMFWRKTTKKQNKKISEKKTKQTPEKTSEKRKKSAFLSKKKKTKKQKLTTFPMNFSLHYRQIFLLHPLKQRSDCKQIKSMLLINFSSIFRSIISFFCTASSKTKKQKISQSINRSIQSSINQSIDQLILLWRRIVLTSSRIRPIARSRRPILRQHHRLHLRSNMIVHHVWILEGKRNFKFQSIRL